MIINIFLFCCFLSCFFLGINLNDPVAYHNRAVAYYCLKQYDRAWGDVNMVKEIGATVNPEVIKMLKEATEK